MFIMDFYFIPIFIQLPERICLNVFKLSFLPPTLDDFFCRTAMQKRSEEAV